MTLLLEKELSTYFIFIHNWIQNTTFYIPSPNLFASDTLDDIRWLCKHFSFPTTRDCYLCHGKNKFAISLWWKKMFPISFGKNARSKKTEEADFMLQLSHAK